MQQICANPWCKQQFEITDDDLKFYEKVSPIFNGKKELIPPPTMCPDCRSQRRYAVRNERKIYKRTCDITGEEIISLYSKDKPYIIYKDEEWWTDKWDPMKYETAYNPAENFFTQLSTLILKIPRRASNRNGSDENCHFTTYGFNNKNCYMTYGCVICEDVYHSLWTYISRNSMDCLMSGEGEGMYECIDCKKCNQCFYCHDCIGCNDVYLSEDCRNCTYCICCKNLRAKKYHIYNQPVTKEEYELRLQELREKGLMSEIPTFNTWKLKFPCCYRHSIASEQTTGDYLENAKNCFECFDIAKGAEDCKYCQFGGMQCKDIMDSVMLGLNAELLYEVCSIKHGTNCAFLNFCQECDDCYYCDNCNSCTNCFGCCGIKRKQYCILNKQYTKKEYEKLVPKIVAKMKGDKEFGEFFPIAMSTFAYNETLAQEYFPLTKNEVLQRGWKWREEKDEIPNVEKIIPAAKLPDNIDAIPDDILNWAIECEATKRPFRIVKQELEFYRKMQLPIPHFHPDERHKRRMALRNPRKLWNRNCMKCGEEMETTYNPERKEKVYCEECYLKEVY